jgi:hypothetical protein
MLASLRGGSSVVDSLAVVEFEVARRGCTDSTKVASTKI